MLTELRLDDVTLAGNEEQLALIMENCPNIKNLVLIYGKRNGELSNLDFLKKGKNLEKLELQSQPEMDYSAISECVKLKKLNLLECGVSDFSMLDRLENLESLELSGTGISEAGDILNLKNLKTLYIEDTPLAENEEQLQLIYNQFPDIELKK